MDVGRDTAGVPGAGAGPLEAKLKPNFGRWLFFRGLALSYLFAFGSLAFQIEGLLGSDGILPAEQFLTAVAKNLGPIERVWRVPTLFWISAGDGALLAVCWIGVIAALVLLAGALHRPMLIACWILFLSISSVGRDFLAFQWDILLLEVGLAALLIAPRGWFPKWAVDQPSDPIAAIAVRLILFKLMFSSGVVKLSSGDETWRSLTALLYHYETQPLPTWIGWYAHQLPEWFQRVSVVGVFVAQLGLPFGIFLPRLPRLIAAAGLLGLQVLIAATGNYCYFNLLAVSLILLLLDDLPPLAWRRSVTAAAASLLILMNVLILIETVFDDLPEPAYAVIQSVRQFRSANGYGLFASMTTDRKEIVIEGSDDGVRWLEYQLPHQPGPLDRAPSFVAPHQPRLDWQMWFAALGTVRYNPWFGSLAVQLLRGSDDVRSLFSVDPFSDHPPRYVRARLYRYRFTDLETKRTTGHWWHREPAGDYLPAVSLDDLKH